MVTDIVTALLAWAALKFVFSFVLIIICLVVALVLGSRR